MITCSIITNPFHFICFFVGTSICILNRTNTTNNMGSTNNTNSNRGICVDKIHFVVEKRPMIDFPIGKAGYRSRTRTGARTAQELADNPPPGRRAGPPRLAGWLPHYCNGRDIFHIHRHPHTQLLSECLYRPRLSPSGQKANQ